MLEISCSFLEQSAKTLQKPPERGGPRESNATDIMSSSDDDIQEAESSPRSALSVQQQSIMLSRELLKYCGSTGRVVCLNILSSEIMRF